MKTNNLYKMLLAVLVFLGIMSCQDRELITIEPESAPIVMDLSTQNLVLDPNFPSNPAITVSWDPAKFNVPVETKYSVEISATEGFETKEVVGSTTQSVTHLSFSNVQMNNAAKKIGFVPGVAQKMYFRVVSFIGVNDYEQVSNVTNLMITPYLAAPIYNFVDLYLIGDATAAAWDNNADNKNLLPLLKTAEDNQYTFTGFFKQGGFKMIKVKGSWDAQFGLGAASGMLSIDGGSGNIPVAADGYYKLTVNTADLTYTFEPATVSTTTYDNISIIGNVNGNWDTDTQLTQSTFDPHVWSIHSVSLKEGEFKFRANNAWDVSWGTNAAFFGTAVQGGDNIPLGAEWTYDVYFNDATGAYTIIPVE
ncbi:SusF/SusE family outer membrane protein [Kaistella sp.]|uniref:SusF/SusE family outer membrane protein n=1 Tax=Kaistella sp. TaxID=2782235 RepID=UPI002F92C5EA